MKYCDSHVHYDHKKFDCGRDDLLRKMHNEGLVACVNPAIGFESNEQMFQRLSAYDWVYFAVGIHPNCVPPDDANDEFYEAGLREFAKRPRVVAVGETGLDYYRAGMNPQIDVGTVIERQKVWFRKSIELAIEFDLPLILHIREAYEDALEILDEYASDWENSRENAPEIPSKLICKKRGVAHCFGGDLELAQEFIKRGFLLGIGGRITYEQEEDLRRCVREVPMEYILLETDAPFVTPIGAAGKRNSSENLHLVANEIAKLKGVSVEDVFRVTKENAEKIFFT